MAEAEPQGGVWRLAHGKIADKAVLITYDAAVEELTAEGAPFHGEDERVVAELDAGRQLLGAEAVYLKAGS